MRALDDNLKSIFRGFSRSDKIRRKENFLACVHSKPPSNHEKKYKNLGQFYLMFSHTRRKLEESEKYERKLVRER